MKVKTNGKWSKDQRPVRSAVVGYRAEQINLNGEDLRELSAMSDRDLCATVRQLSGRVNRAGGPLNGKPYHTGGTVTGRLSKPVVGEHGLAAVGRREGQKVNYVRIESSDFADVERRALAQLSRAFGLPGSFVLGTGEIVMNERAFAYFLRDPVAVDEEGCGAFFGALYEAGAWG